MKKILSLIIYIYSMSFTLHAEDRIDLGEMQLDTEYKLEDFKNYIGTFTAPKTGVLTCSATTIDVMYPYKEVLDDMYTEGNAYEVSMNSLYGSRSYDFSVEEGKTYIMYANFIMNSNTVFKMTMANESTINLTSTSPAEGSTIHVSNGGQISINFDKGVAFTSATLNVGEYSMSINGTTVGTPNSIYFEIKNELWDLLTSGKAKPGDEMTITIEGVCAANDKSVLYNGDGRLQLHLVMGSMPITLLSAEHTSGNFLSYYTSKNEAGLIKLHFSGKVNTSMLKAQIKYGTTESESEGEYYTENLTPTLEDGGTTVVFNLQGKRRKAKDMVTSGTDYGMVTLGITGVLDLEGNYSFSPGQGSLGSYWYTFDYQEVNANIFCEFTPNNGSTLDDSSQSIELWITDEGMLCYDGIQFAYTQDNEEKTIILDNTQYEKVVDPDEATAAILTIPVPAEVLTGNEVRLSLVNLEAADGNDYSETLSATFATTLPTSIVNVNQYEDDLLHVGGKNTTYNLHGQRVTDNYHGIIIHQGRKTIQ